MMSDLIEKLRQVSSRQAARLVEDAAQGSDSHPEVIRALRDERIAYLREHISLSVLAGIAERMLERLQESGPAPALGLRRQAWDFLDVVRRSEVLVRIEQDQAVEEWSERILRLVDSSHFTFGQLFLHRVASFGNRTLFRLSPSEGNRTLSWHQVAVEVERIARGLTAITSETGGRPVAILSENRLEVALLDLACLGNGIVDVMIPATATDREVGYILRHAGVGTVITSNREQLQKVLMHREHLSDLGKVIVMDEEAASASHVLPFEEIYERASEVSSETLFERRGDVRIGDLATVMYTSGTTGMPKGIMFSHRNIVFKRFARALALPEIGEGDRFLCFLPLFHTFGRYLELAACVFWGATYCFAESPALDTLVRQMRELEPTVFISIPMKWNQLYERIGEEVDIEAASDDDILAVTRRTTGGRLRWGLSAAGYLNPDVFRFFQRQGIELMSGFGMTEATGGITMTPPGRYKDGSLGRALPGIDLTLAEDGELKIRGPYVMLGYLDPPDGEASFDQDGWLPTGDIMEMDEEGFIRLVDRKKEIYKNEKGQTIAPQKVENLFRDFESVGRVFLVGDHRSYNTALIYPNPEFSELDLKSLSREELKAHFRSLVVSANSFVEPYERIVDFAVIDRDFDAGHGELTPKGTFRRKAIERNFSDVIELLYRRTTRSIGGATITVPNWFFQKLGITTQDLHTDEEHLFLDSTGTQLTVRKTSHDELQLGSVLYRCGKGPVDIGVLLRTPSLWLGNEELVQFAPLDLKQRHRRRQVPADLEWYRRVGVHETSEADRQSVEGLLTKKDVDFMDTHRVATLLEAAEPSDAVLAVRVLEYILSLDDGQMVPVARRLLRRAKFSSHPEVVRRAFQVLMWAEQPRIFRHTLASFLDVPAMVLDEDTIAVLVERHVDPERLDTLIAEAEERCLEDSQSSVALATKKALLDFISELGAAHPSRYRQLRGFLTRMSKTAKEDEIREHAHRARERAEQGFRSWLGPATRIAVDPETEREYRWEDVSEFDRDVDEEAKRRLLDSFKSTALLREAVFLFYGTTIRLEDILPNGLWVRLLGREHGKSVYRVAIRTRSNGQYDLAINLNQSLSADEIRDEIDGLILCGEPGRRGPLAESFGGYWSEQDLWSEEFIAGETLDRALKRLSRQSHEEERFLGIWPYAAWSAASAYVDLWERTGEVDPRPGNVIAPMHDYHTGARLVSMSGRRPVPSIYALLVSMRERLVVSIETEHPRLKGLVGWDILFSSVLEVLGEKVGIQRLRGALQESKSGGDQELGDALESFLTSVDERGFLPISLFFAAKRYRRWAELNPNATLSARAATLQEMYRTYNLSDLQSEYPEARVRFFRETVFREVGQSLAEGLSNIVGRLRLRAITPDDLSVAVTELRGSLELEAAEDYFLTRLSFPYLRPEDEAVFVPAETGGTHQSEMVVIVEDAEGNPYRIRHALSPKEVGKLHSLFLAAHLPVQFRPDHRFLVAVHERGNLIGGLFYEVDAEARTAHMDKVVVAERFQRKGVAGALLEELSNRLRTAGYRSLTTGFFRPQFFYRYGFTVERRYAGLVKSLAPGDQESSDQ